MAEDISKLSSDLDLYLNVIGEDSSLEFLHNNFISYASDKIKDQAIPSMVDGLNPSQKAFILSLQDLKAYSDAKPQKSQRVNSQQNANYRPSASCYDVLVNMSQFWKNPVRLTAPSGNWGEIEGNPAAAERYTEINLSKFGEFVMLDDLPNKTRIQTTSEPYSVVPTNVTYTDLHWEEQYLPAKLPFILMNGSTGIAVGIAQTWQPLSAEYVINQAVRVIQNKAIDYGSLTMGYVTQPNIVSSPEETVKVFQRGRGSIRLAAKYNLVYERKKVVAIEVTNTPPSLTLNSIGDKLNQWRILSAIDCPFEEFRNESEGNSILLRFNLKKAFFTDDDTRIESYISRLFDRCGLEVSETVNMVALHNNYPNDYSLESLLVAWCVERMDIVKRRASYEYLALNKQVTSQAFLLFSKDHFSDVAAILQNLETAEEVAASLYPKYVAWCRSETGLGKYNAELVSIPGLESDEQTFIAYTLDLRLRQVSKLSAQTSIKRMSDLLESYLYWLGIYESEEARREYIVKEMLEIRDNLETKYGIHNYVCEYTSSNIQKKSAKKPLRELLTESMQPIDPQIVLYTKAGFLIKLSNRAVKSAPHEPQLLSGDIIRSAVTVGFSHVPAIGASGRLMLIDLEDLTNNKAISAKMLESKYKDYPVAFCAVIHEDYDSIFTAHKDGTVKLVTLETLGSLRKTMKFPDEVIFAGLVNRKRGLSYGSGGKLPLSKLEEASPAKVTRLLKTKVGQLNPDGFKALSVVSAGRAICKI